MYDDDLRELIEALRGESSVICRITETNEFATSLTVTLDPTYDEGDPPLLAKDQPKVTATPSAGVAISLNFPKIQERLVSPHDEAYGSSSEGDGSSSGDSSSGDSSSGDSSSGDSSSGDSSSGDSSSGDSSSGDSSSGDSSSGDSSSGDSSSGDSSSGDSSSGDSSSGDSSGDSS